jgi:FkbM family methyltransferase
MLNNLRATITQIRRESARKYLDEISAEHLQEFPQLCCYSFDRISNAIFIDGRLDKKALVALLALIGDRLEGRLVLDIGANIGNHSLAFAERAGKVLSFEPHPITFRLLDMNLGGVANAEAINLGASNQRKRVRAISPRANFGASAITERRVDGDELVFEFDVAPLDSIELVRRQKVALIKLDVEGHELQVLEGASGLLGSDRPIVVFEQNQDAIANGSSPCMEFLQSVGYRHFYALDERIPWRTPQSWPSPLRKFGRLIEAMWFGPSDWIAELTIVEKLDPRDYPMLVAFTEALTS